MSRALLIVVAGLLISGCSTQLAPQNRAQPSTLAGDRFNHSRYVEQRAEFLLHSGAIKDRNVAASQARDDAARIFGEAKSEYGSR